MASRNVGLVAVGVDTTVALAPLRGAASGATRIAQWLREQAAFGVSFFIEELTDANGAKVSARNVQDAVRKLIDRGDLDLLILYFAGHGIVKSGNDEQVLLSEVKTYKDEAIAIAPTVSNAFYSTVPHVLVISDACRNAIDPFSELGTVAGKPALDRRAVVGVKKSKVDVFYATEPSQTAKEFNGEGFFTDVLLDVLRNPPGGVTEMHGGLDEGVEVVPTWNLEKHLSAEVPLRASKQTPSFEQTPDFYVTSREPQFLGFARVQAGVQLSISVETLGRPYGGVAPDLDRLTAREFARTRRAALNEVADALNGSALDAEKVTGRISQEAGLADRVGAYLGSEHGRPAFETRTGYSVLGGKVDKVLLSGGHSGELANTQEGRQSIDVRLYPRPFSSPPQEQRGTVALLFQSGTVCFLPILPGYVGTVGLRDGLVASLSFEVSKQLQQGLGETEAERKEFAARRALAAALSSSGKLHKLAKATGSAYASILRQSKRVDPALGIYAAYAYALSGNEDDAASVFDWVRQYPSLDPSTGLAPAPVPFDVALLAGKLPGAFGMSPGVAPFCPLMTLGWSVMSSYVPAGLLHPSILAAGTHRLNSEWSTFRTQDVRPLLEAFEKGELP
jgi:hypothetical protein